MSATNAQSLRAAVHAYCNPDDSDSMRRYARFNEPLNQALDKLAELRRDLEKLANQLNDADDRVSWTTMQSFVNHIGYSNTLVTELAEFQRDLTAAYTIAMEIVR